MYVQLNTEVHGFLLRAMVLRGHHAVDLAIVNCPPDVTGHRVTAEHSGYSTVKSLAVNKFRPDALEVETRHHSASCRRLHENKR